MAHDRVGPGKSVTNSTPSILQYFDRLCSTSSTMYSMIIYFRRMNRTQAAIYFGISTGIPMVYLSYVSAVIYRCGLIPSTTGKLKVMTSYFLQIIWIFIFLWLPGMILLALSRKPQDRINIIYHFNTEYQSSLFLLA